MKKILNIVLVAFIYMISSMFITVCADAYDTAWKMTIENPDSEDGRFKKGDIITVDIINTDYISSVTDVVIKFTFNGDLLEYAASAPVCGLASRDSSRDISYEELNTSGLFRGAFATATNAEISAGQSMYKIYFKVKEDIPDGITALNFRWIHVGDDKSYVANSGSNYNIDFTDTKANAEGDELSENPDKLPGSSEAGNAYVFAPLTNPTPENPETVNLNGKIITLTTPYVVVFSKLLPASSEYLEAGIMLSENADENMDKDTDDVHYVKAEKFASDNRFGVLFYGKGIKAGTDYYLRARVEYEDFTLFGDMLTITTAE